MAMQNTDAATWLADTFARNRAMYGGWTMELDESGSEETPAEENPPAGDEGGNEGGEETPPEEIPADVLRANLTKANQEAARYRTRLREVEKALEGRKTDEEVQALLDNLTTERETAERSLLIENVALKHNLLPELAARLSGNTREELEADALTLAKFAPSNEGNPGDLDGGLNPGNESNTDGPDAARARVRQIKGRR